MAQVVYAIISVLVVAAILVAFLAFRRPRDGRGRNRGLSDEASLWMAFGMLAGAIVGVVAWIATDAYVTWVICLAAGMTIGLALGLAREPRR
jgi:hypothetical protein